MDDLVGFPFLTKCKKELPKPSHKKNLQRTTILSKFNYDEKETFEPNGRGQG
jgi:hypothetical protein